MVSYVLYDSCLTLVWSASTSPASICGALTDLTAALEHVYPLSIDDVIVEWLGPRPALYDVIVEWVEPNAVGGSGDLAIVTRAGECGDLKRPRAGVCSLPSGARLSLR